MPTYDYECKNCNNVFEVFHGITENPVTSCPACRGTVNKRLIGCGTGIIFKGSGFYSTDNKRSCKITSPSNPKTSDSKTGASCGSLPGAVCDRSSDSKSCENKYSETRSGENKSIKKEAVAKT